MRVLPRGGTHQSFSRKHKRDLGFGPKTMRDIQLNQGPELDTGGVLIAHPVV